MGCRYQDISPLCGNRQQQAARAGRSGREAAELVSPMQKTRGHGKDWRIVIASSSFWCQDPSINTPPTKTANECDQIINQNISKAVNHKANRSNMLSRSASLLSKRAGYSISTAVSKQLAPAVAATSSGSSSANVSLPSNQRQYTTHSQLPEEHQMIYEMCRNFANEELAPNAGEWDQKHAFPTEAITHMVRYRT